MVPRPRRSNGSPAERNFTFTSEQRNKIMAALNGDYGFGTRATFLHRTCAAFLKFSPRAWLLYIDLCSFLGVDKSLSKDCVRVAMKKIAEWLDCDERTAQRVVRELTRSGPLPLVMEKPGRQGRVSEYMFVRDPFKIAAVQAVEAARSKMKRGGAIVTKQLAIQQAAQRGDITADEADRKLRATALRRVWNTPTRPVPVVVEQPTDPRRDQFAGDNTAEPALPAIAQNADERKTPQSIAEMLAQLDAIAARKGM